MSEYEVAIRLLDEESGFAYTVSREGRVIDAGRVDDGIAPGYYGGSEAMD
jgi:hypothetical protein